MDKLHLRLKEERQRLDITQTEFSALASVTPQTQRKYEKGTRFPDVRYLQAIAKHGVDTHYLLHGVRLAQPDQITASGLDILQYCQLSGALTMTSTSLTMAVDALARAKSSLEEFKNDHR